MIWPVVTKVAPLVSLFLTTLLAHSTGISFSLFFFVLKSIVLEERNESVTPDLDFDFAHN